MNTVDFEEFVSVFRARTAARLTEFERVLDDVAKDIEQRAQAASSRGGRPVREPRQVQKRNLDRRQPRGHIQGVLREG